MKIKLPILLFFCISISLKAQIIITSADMPVTGDTLRVSVTTNLQGKDPTLTGNGYNWDFSQLEPDAQLVEQYVNTSATPLIYQFIFNQNVANLASPIDAIDFIPGLELTDTYIFYKRNTGNYVRAGYAATVAGFPLPIKFDQPELFYTFPLTAGSVKDSSTSSFSLGLPGVGYLSIERKRTNETDGWGSLTTPFGTFEVIRVKSTIYERDSIYIDSIQTGLPIIRNFTEYQWLGKNQGIPLLSVTTEGPLITARYRDLATSVSSLLITTEDQTICSGETANISVNVSGGLPPYSYLWSTGEKTQTINVFPEETTAYSVLVTDSNNLVALSGLTVNVIPFIQLELGHDTLLCTGNSLIFDAGDTFDQVKWFVDDVLFSEQNSVTIDTSILTTENALVRVEFSSGQCSGSDEIDIQFYDCQSIKENITLAFSLTPNPTNDLLMVGFKNLVEAPDISIYSIKGQRMENALIKIDKDYAIISTARFAPGSYLLKVKSKLLTGTSVFIKQ